MLVSVPTPENTAGYLSQIVKGDDEARVKANFTNISLPLTKIHTTTSG